MTGGVGIRVIGIWGGEVVVTVSVKPTCGGLNPDGKLKR